MKKRSVIIIVAAMAIVAAVALLILRHNSRVNDPRYWEVTDANALSELPPLVILRPTRFPHEGISIRDGHRIVAKNMTILDLLSVAYDSSRPRMVLPGKLPEEHFDLLLTFTNRPLEIQLQGISSKRFGLNAHRETRDTDVLRLKVRNPNAPGLRISAGGEPSAHSGFREFVANNVKISGLARGLDWRFGKPVIDQTGLDGCYDIHLQWQPRAGESDNDAFQRALLEQLGLELVPGREPVEMLVVEKTK